VDRVAPALPRAEAGLLKRLLLLAVVAVAAGIAGGWLLFEEVDDDEPDAAEAGWSTCTNTVHGFSIDYPPAWYTDHPTPEFACFYFDPRRFEVPAVSDFTGTALQVAIEDADGEAAGSEPEEFERVDDELAVFGYRVREGDRVFSVFTTANQGVDFAPWRRIVERAVTSLRFTERGRRTVEGADVVPPQAGLPRPVAAKRAAIWEAAKSGDYEAVARLADPDGFEYTFGGPVPGGPAAYWRRIDQTTDERPIQTLAEILELPYAHQAESKLYVWPDAFTRNAATLSPDEKEKLGEAIGDEALRLYEQLGNYLGYRAGIDEDGDWVFYVAGD
jgi:hypothetical protein